MGASALAPTSKKKGAATPDQITSGYQKLVFAVVASAPRGGASYPYIHLHVSEQKENANRKLVTKAVNDLLEGGFIRAIKLHARKFVTNVTAPPAKKASKKAPAKKKKKTTKKKSSKKVTKKTSKKKKSTKKKPAKKISKKAAPKKKKAASSGPKVTGYQKLALDAVAGAPRGGISHTQIHASIKSANAKANKTFITKAVRALVAAGYIASTKRHKRKFVVSKN